MSYSPPSKLHLQKISQFECTPNLTSSPKLQEKGQDYNEVSKSIKFICLDVRLTKYCLYMNSKKKNVHTYTSLCANHEASSKCKSENVDESCPYIISSVTLPPNITCFLPQYHFDFGYWWHNGLITILLELASWNQPCEMSKQALTRLKSYNSLKFF